MNDEILNGTPILEETTYDPSSVKKNNSLDGMTAPVLDDIDYSAPSSKKGDPTGVSAPVLDDMDSYSYDSSSKKGTPQGVSAPVLDSMDEYTPEQKAAKPVVAEPEYIDDATIISGFTAEQKAQFDILPPEKQKMVINFRRKQLAESQPVQNQETELKAPVLDEENYVPPVKDQPKYEETVQKPILDEENYVPPVKEEKTQPDYEEPLQAPVLDEQPETPEYVPTYVDQDLEKIKQEAKKKSVEAQLSSNQKDEKESLRMMQQLREEREQRDAKQGFKLTAIIAVIGVISAILFVLFASGDYFGLSYKEGTGNKLREIVSQYSVYIGAIVGVSSLLLITGVKALKGLITTIFLLFTVILVFPGIVMLMQKDGSMALNVILYALSIVGSGYTFFSLTSNEKIGLFFTKKF